MKLSTKIAGSMAALAVLMAVLGCYLLLQMQKSVDLATRMATRNIPLISLCDGIQTELVRHRLYESYHIFSQNPQQMAANEAALVDIKKRIGDSRQKIQALLFTDEGRGIAERFDDALRAYYRHTDDIIGLSRALKPEEAMNLMRGESFTAFQKVDNLAADFSAYQMNMTDKANREDDIRAAAARRVGLGLMAAALVIAAVLSILTVSNTTKLLGKDPDELNAVAGRVMNGDYNVDDGDPGRGVYGAIVNMVGALKNHIENAQRESENARAQSAKAVEAMEAADAAGREARAKHDSLLAAADRLQEVADIVSSASTELSAQIEQCERGAAEQAARVTETATAMDEMNCTVIEVAKNAGAASDVSAGTREKAQHGAEIVARAVEGIRQVQQESLALKSDMTTLSEHARSITQIMNVISDIADQTNLLALNAAIEAARAGEAGRGFAVVADEVRKLAEKTMASTANVGDAIKAIQDSASKSMSQVDRAVKVIEEATALSNESGKALEEIVTMADDTADQVRAIATAAEEQSASSEEISRSITLVNSIAGETARAMAESSTAVAGLAEQAQILSGLIDEMKRG